MSKLNKIQRKKEKKSFFWNWDGFSVRIEVTSKQKSLHWNWDGFVNMKLPKILTQTCPKNMKLPKILTWNRHFKTKRGGSAPPPFTPMAWRKNWKKFILAWVSTSIVYNRNKSQRYIKNDWMQIYRQEKFPCKAEISKRWIVIARIYRLFWRNASHCRFAQTLIKNYVIYMTKLKFG